MKNLKLLIPVLVFAVGVFLAGCSKTQENTDATNKDGNTETTTQTSNDNMMEGETVMINLPSMQCNTCKKTITTAVKEVDGVKDVDVSVKDKTVKVVFDKSKTDLSKIESSITGAGYDANDKKADKEAYDKLDDCCKVPADQKDKDMHM
ncbi:MAG: heavy-metal-associated domain-containing protein [Ignavibacteriae bacterium]|nr:heavy-metal-associated domain-containing protein [Ignavibacteriota bacterium]MCB0724804.1 heavy-metal-associated domain-containing protein [Ignavibacteriota bacterium]MCB9242183.1 heavy-metal-associated domain-containing protein [Ignavibacteriales bacterium]